MGPFCGEYSDNYSALKLDCIETQRQQQTKKLSNQLASPMCQQTATHIRTD